jgi:hypothetical protein
MEARESANDFEGTMADKTKTVVTFESHERTVVRRSRRALSAQGQPTLTVAPIGIAGKARTRLRTCWRVVALKLTKKKRSRT